MKKIYLGVWSLVSVSTIVFTVLLYFSSCNKDKNQTSARGSLQYADGSCRAFVVHGHYFTGTSAGTDTNYVQINVNVTRPGSYKIVTDRQNGVAFQASGTFNDTGVNIVRMTSSGSFINTGVTDFNVSFDTSYCQFSVDALDSTGLAMPDNSWRFTAGGHIYQGPGTGTYYAQRTFTADGFEFVGSMEGFSDTSLTVDFAWYVGIDSNGAHITTLGNTYFHFITSRFSNTGQVRLDANPQTGGVSLFVRQQPWATGIWTFGGTALDANNHIVPITNGVFKSTHYGYVSQ